MVKLFRKNLWLFLVLVTLGLQAQTTVSGRIMDGEYNEPLIGANVLIQGTTTGTSTDLDGNFTLTSSQPLPWDLEISYTGFEDQSITVTNPTSNLNINMASSAILTDEIVISASRRREKIQEAPASISVINARKLESSPNENPARNLINVPGVTIQQQSAGRINIQLRGDGGLFGSATFPILDYRSLSGPGLGTFDALNSPLNNLDISRIEVVRGPGSALYGPGVTAGVVHFISKSAIDEPCTSVELIGGELNTFGGSFRHATKVSDKFGFKINGVFKRGDEFTLDPNSPEDRIQIDQFATSISRPVITNGTVDATQQGEVLLTERDLDPDGDGNVMQDFWNQAVINGTLEFRPQDDLSMVLSGGYNQASAVFYNSQGEGLSQASEQWIQGRVQKGGLFAQAFFLNNTGGSDDKPTFLYQTGLTTQIARQQIEAQVQYNFDTPGLLNSVWTTGFDYRLSKADTKNTVYGREEEDDDFAIAGAYLQGKFALNKKLDIVLAGRGDKFNFVDEVVFSPRAVAVFKPSPRHTIRAGFNRAQGAPSQLQVNIDFPVSSPVPGAFDIWLLGNKEAQTFTDPQIVFNGLIPLPPLPVGTPGFPNAYTFGAVNGAVQAQLIPGIQAQFEAGGLPTAQAAGLAGAIQGYLNDPANTPAGFTGNFVGINLFNGEQIGTTNAPAAQIRTEDTWEIGYKGLIGDRLGVTIDLYNRDITGATLFTAISPSWLPVGAQFGNDLGTAIGNTGVRDFMFNLLGGDLNPAAGPTADALNAAIVGAYTAGGDGFEANIAPLLANAIFATTPTDQVPDDGVTHLSAGYRTFESFSYTGTDIGLEYYVNDNLSLFGNYTWISENIFNPVIQGSDGATEQTSISQPLNKFRLGFNYAQEYGLRANLAFQHDDSYEVFLGDFSGIREETNLVDAGVGYKMNNGLTLSVTAQNLFDSEYRAYPHFPKIGRRVLATLRYDLCGGKVDSDNDGIADDKDNCPNVAGLKAYNGCPDTDGDGIIDGDDACPSAAGSRDLMGCPDGDGDGVADKDDMCPTTAGTLNGCPDSDGDGVADKDDACPTVAGTIGGCPDSDGDGVIDGNDACPTVAGTVGGCPDSDGDGVADKDDACPDVAGTDNGCPSDPDTDGDGIVDSKDRCPQVAGTVNGCPDGDKDGIADMNDSCPTLGGTVDSKGCPVVAEATKQLFSRALQGIQFETGSNRIKSSSIAILNEVVVVMRQNPSYKLTIAGHTDSVGSSASNQALSQRRADAVKKYLTEKGIPTGSVASVGYGEDRPVADNINAAGRRQNRRVELSVDYLK